MNIPIIIWRIKMLKVVKPSEIESVIGTEVGLSDWVKVDQERINKFAEATLDNQFIHVDPEQATPVFGSTIAHGFLSLSLAAGIGIRRHRLTLTLATCGLLPGPGLS